MRAGRERGDSKTTAGGSDGTEGESQGLAPTRLRMALKRRAAQRADEAAAPDAEAKPGGAAGGDDKKSEGEAEAKADAEPQSAEQADEAAGDVAETKDGANDPQAALALAITGRLIPLPHADALPPTLRGLAKRVKCYVGPAAKRACKMMGAEAFTVGDVIAFATDAPPVDVVLHELEHVRQQGAAPADAAAPLETTAPGDHDEAEAKQAETGDAKTGDAKGQAADAKTEAADAKTEAGDASADGDGAPKLARYEALVSPSPAPVVQLRTTPDDPNAVFTLPAETRIRRVATRPGAHPGEAGWVQVEVTTGDHMGRTGWVTDANLAQRNETTEIPYDDAVRLHRELTGASLPGTNTPIPFHYPPDGCYARAHIMSSLLTQKGYASQKVFAVSQKSRPGGGPAGGGLNVQSPFAADAQPGAGPNVNWWYHVAPIIQVRMPVTNQITEMVIDPSIFNGPVPVGAWTGSMSPEKFERIPDGGLQAVLANPGANANNGFPVDRPMTFTADRNAMFPADAAHANTADQANQQYAMLAQRMQYYAWLSGWHQLAADLRTALAQIPPNNALVLQKVQQAHAINPGNLAFFFGPRTAQYPDGHFPNLLTELRAKLPPDVMAQIDALLQQSQSFVAQQAAAAAAAGGGGNNNAGGGGGGGGGS